MMTAGLLLRTFVHLGLIAAASSLPRSLAAEDYSRWEKDIQAFEAMDRTNPPPRNAVLFVGSSSIRLWKSLATDFPETPVLNRGFGGCHMGDVFHFSDRIVLPYRPAQIFVYAGDNDLAAGKTPERVAQDFSAFVRRVRQELPNVPIGFIAIKPSPSRWHLAEQVRQANRLVADEATRQKQVKFIDVFTPMLGSDGKPRADLFVEDKLHLNAQGYQLWRTIIRPHILAQEKETKPR